MNGYFLIHRQRNLYGCKHGYSLYKIILYYYSTYEFTPPTFDGRLTKIEVRFDILPLLFYTFLETLSPLCLPQSFVLFRDFTVRL